MKNYDFVVVGAGVTGAWIAYELSKYNVKVAVLEKENDCAMGTSKANSAILHAGYDPEPGTLMAKLNVKGNAIVRECHERMGIPFRQVGSLVVAFNDEGMAKVNSLFARGVFNKVPDLKILSKEEVKEMEPHMSDACMGALWAPTAGVVNAFELTAAPLEVAVTNGVEFLRNTKLEKVEKKSEGFLLNGEISTKFVINAAGLYADEVASLFGDDTISIKPRRGEYSILDNNVGYLASTVIFQPPTSLGKGILVSPTVDGNILVGPTADDINDKADLATTPEGQKAAFDGARLSIPEVSERDVITSFSGNRAVSNSKDFILAFSSVEGLYNVAGICSPGLSAAPAIAEYVVESLKEKNLVPATKKDSYNNSRKVVRFSELSDEEKHQVIHENPLYGRIICRCETVTEGEIIDAIRRPAGARDMDGVKRRVRAGMGRCQGGFCGPRVMDILSKELGIPYTEVTKFGRGSWMTGNKRGKEASK